LGYAVKFNGRTKETKIVSSQSRPLVVQNLNRFLEPIRSTNELPALAALALKDGKVVGLGAVGVRKWGETTPVTIKDKFHLGSCTKAMTAHLCASLLESGKLKKETTLAKALPDMAATMHPSYRDLTLDHLLSHRSGFPGESWLKGRDFQETRRFPGAPRQQREVYLRAILQEAPDAPPGSKYIYSNRNFIVAGVLAERTENLPWEELMQLRVFRPLKIRGAGYGAMGKPGKIEEPWQHLRNGSSVIPIEPGPNSDNPSPLAPAGTVHMPIEDWARFVQDHLSGLRGEGGVLHPASYPYLHQPLFGGEYRGGWIATDRPWGGGRVSMHAGSNTQNFAVVWMAPRKNFAALAVTNLGGEGADKACDKTIATLIQTFLG
jgi:CubicO group peptidase (beta-lactamase class C family)